MHASSSLLFDHFSHLAISVHVPRNFILIQSDFKQTHSFPNYFHPEKKIIIFFFSVVIVCARHFTKIGRKIAPKSYTIISNSAKSQRGLHIFTTLIVIAIIAAHITDVLIESETESTLSFAW